MRVRCEQCEAQYNVDDSRIPEQGVSITCPKCKNSFIVKPEAATPVPSTPAVPLPGAAAPATPPPPAVPLPGAAAPATPPPPAVPLPGAAAPATPPTPAVPLPGAAAPATPPPPAVPLPGANTPGDIFGDSSPAPRASGLGDIFGDLGGSDNTQDSVAPHPFHGDSVLEKSSAGGGLSDFIDQQGPAAPKANAVVSYQIRKSTGRVFGPYDENSILQMLRAQELAGNEEASVDGDNWTPLAQIPIFGEEIQAMMAASLGSLDADLPGLSHADLPGIPNADLPGIPNADLPGIPNADLPGIPNADLPGIPNADLPGIPDIGLPGLGRADLPADANSGLPGLPKAEAKNAPAMWNPDERANSQAVPDFMNDIGLTSSPVSSGPVLNADAGADADAQFDPLDPLAADLSSKALEQRAQKKRAQRRSATRTKTGPIVKLALIFGSLLLLIVVAGVFSGIVAPDSYGWFGIKWLDRTYLNPPKQVVAHQKIVEVPYDASKVQAFIDQGSYQAYQKALPFLTGDASSNPKAAADLAYIYAKMALVHHDLDKIPSGKAALSKASALEGNQRALFAGACFDILDKSCDRAAKTLQSQTGLVAPEKPDAEKSELYVLMGLAQACLKKPDMDSAQRFVDASLMNNPEDAFALTEQARLARERKDELTAQGYLQKLLASHPENAQANVLLGHSFSRVEGKTDAAAASYEAAVKLGAKTLAPWEMGRATLGLARIHRARHDFDKASQIAGKAMEAAGTHLPTLKEIGQFSLDMFDFDLAQKVYRKILSVDAADREGVVGLARALTNNRDQLDAFNALQKVLKAHPNDAYLTYWMGQIHLAMGKRKEGRSYIEKSAALDPKFVDAILSLARMDLAEGHVEQAQAQLDDNRAAIKEAEQGRVDIAQAEIFIRLRKFAEALRSLQKADERGWNTAYARVLQADILIAQFKTKEAAPIIRKAYQDNPKDPRMIAQQGLLLLAQDKAQAAMERFDEAAKHNRTQARYDLLRAAGLLALNKNTEAMAAVSTAAEIEPDNIDIYLWKGRVYRAQENYREAINQFTAGGKKSKLDPRFPMELGRTYVAMKSFIDAVDYFKAALIKDPFWAAANYELGLTYFELVRYNTARDYFMQALRLRPDWAVVHLNVGRTLSKGGDYKGALKEFRKAINGDPTLVDAYCRMGWVLKNDGKLKKAESAIERCLKGNPKHQEAYKWLGYIYKDQRQPDKALEAFKRHLMLNSNDIEAELVRDEIHDLETEKSKK